MAVASVGATGAVVTGAVVVLVSVGGAVVPTVMVYVAKFAMPVP
jgi:hypothetical protein